MTTIPSKIDPTEQESTGRTRNLTWMLRLVSLSAGLFILCLFVVARILQPDEAGLGTHMQLGLPPCTSISLLGLPCPSCGMTTAWSLLTRGQLSLALQRNAGGTLLAIIGIAYLPASCYFFFCGRSTRGWFSLALAIAIASALGVSICQWMVRLSVA